MTDKTESRGTPIKTVDGLEMCRLGDVVFLGPYAKGKNIAMQVDEFPFTAVCMYINPKNEMILTYKNGTFIRTFRFRHLPNEEFLYILPSGGSRELNIESVRHLRNIWKQYYGE